MIGARVFGIIGALWVIPAVMLILFWFGAAAPEEPIRLPFYDLSNPIQRIGALILYGPPILMGILFGVDRLYSRITHAQD